MFIFGTEDGVNNFKRVDAIEDFIPNGAYRTIGQHNYSFNVDQSSNADQASNDKQSVLANTRAQSASTIRPVEFSAALILQLMYYQQMAALDKFFGDSYNQMMDRFVSQSNTFRKGLAREFETLYGSKIRMNQLRAPKEKSSERDKIFDIKADTYTYRFLDEENNPYVELYTVNSVGEAAYYSNLKENNTLDTGSFYILKNGFYLKSSEERKILNNQKDTVRSIDQDFTTKLVIPYKKEGEQVVISHELHKPERGGTDSLVSGSSIFPNSLKGLSDNELDLPEPIKSESLILSDIIFGYIDPETDDINRYEITHDREIFKGNNLYIRFEAYNLLQDNEGKSNYTITYTIREAKRGFLGIGGNKDKQDAVTVNNIVLNNRDSNSIIIETSGYEKGKYELLINITDLNSNTSYSRTKEFVIK